MSVLRHEHTGLRSYVTEGYWYTRKMVSSSKQVEMFNPNMLEVNQPTTSN